MKNMKGGSFSSIFTAFGSAIIPFVFYKTLKYKKRKQKGKVNQTYKKKKKYKTYTKKRKNKPNKLTQKK